MGTRKCQTFPNKLAGTKRIPLRRQDREAFINGVMETKPVCPVCKQRILKKFEIGHVLACFHGGDNAYTNLVAVHKHCNVGTDNINDLVANTPGVFMLKVKTKG